MKVGIFFQDYYPHTGGVRTLLDTIKEEMKKTECKHEIIIFISNSSECPRFIINGLTYINLHRRSFFLSLKSRMLRILGINYTTKYAQSLNDAACSENIDLLWILGHLEFDLTIPYVFTVWDLGHRMLPCFPEVSKEGLWEQREKVFQRMLYRATYVITGNETGKKEIQINYPVNPEKIRIIPFPIPDDTVNECENHAEEKEYNIKSPFVFYPAQCWAHKNHVSLIEAIAWIRDSKNIIINCYFVGSDKGNLQHIKDTICKFQLENQIFILGFVARTTLINLYKNALAMTYVSLLGPNNIPPLEALSLGCPLIYSNITGHVEQMEGTGIPVNAKNPVEIGEAILSIYNNPELRKELISDGLIFIKKRDNFSYFKEMLNIIDDFDLYRRTWA